MHNFIGKYYNELSVIIKSLVQSESFALATGPGDLGDRVVNLHHTTIGA